MKAIELQKNDRIHPMGVDDPAPFLRWKCEDGINQKPIRSLPGMKRGKIL